MAIERAEARPGAGARGSRRLMPCRDRKIDIVDLLAATGCGKACRSNGAGFNLEHCNRCVMCYKTFHVTLVTLDSP